MEVVLIRYGPIPVTVKLLISNFPSSVSLGGANASLLARGQAVGGFHGLLHISLYALLYYPTSLPLATTDGGASGASAGFNDVKDCAIVHCALMDILPSMSMNAYWKERDHGVPARIIVSLFSVGLWLRHATCYVFRIFIFKQACI